MKRYDRQIVLSEIGISGQQQLTEAKVLIVGVGGLGCAVLQNLVGAGVGCIGIVDGDVVEETNLHRQYVYTLADSGKHKVTVAAAVVKEQNPEVTIVAYPHYLNETNAAEIVSDYQIVVDCTDVIASRYLINDITLVKGIPMVYASLHRFEGQLSVFHYDNGPSYRCLFPETGSLATIPNCHEAGVLGVLPNLLGVMQATEVLKIILGIGEVVTGKLILYNALSNNMQTIDFQKNEVEIKKGKQNGCLLLNRTLAEELEWVSPDSFFTALRSPDSLVIDIRELYEEPRLSFENVKSVPLAQLEDYLEGKEKYQKIVLFCQNGNRSKSAVAYLKKMGYVNSYHLDRGVEALAKILL